MPHEEAILISPLDEKMEQELVKANVTDAVISALKEKYGNLRLRSVDDKETYLEIKDAKKDCAKLRNLAIKVCKEGREQAVAIQKKWVAKQNEVVGHIEQVESPLDAEIDRFDSEVSRKEQEEKQRQETMYMQRTQALTKLGALYSDNSFVLGEFSLEANLVKESSKEVWDEEILPKFNEQFFILEAERIEQEKIKAEQEAEVKRQREQLEKEQEEFARQKQAEELRIREEQREKERAENAAREKIQNKRMSEIIGYKPKNMTYQELDGLWAMTDEDFVTFKESLKVKFDEETQRIQKEIEAAAAQRERERIIEEQRQAEIKRQQEEAKKAEELAKAGDKAIWNDFIQKIGKISVPVLKSGQYKKVGNIAKEKIEEILALKPY